MSKFYVTSQGYRKNGEPVSQRPSTARGFSWVRTSIQSWEGSVGVELREVEGEIVATITVASDSDDYPSKILLHNCPLQELAEANHLRVEGELPSPL